MSHVTTEVKVCVMEAVGDRNLGRGQTSVLSWWVTDGSKCGGTREDLPDFDASFCFLCSHFFILSDSEKGIRRTMRTIDWL